MKFRKHLSSTNFYLKSVLYSSLLALLAFTACEVEEPIPTYTLTTTISPTEGGKITVSPQDTSYPEGSQVTLTPEANENWVFKQWEGDAIGNTTPLQLTMTTNKAITGVFIKRDYPLNIKIEGEGTVEEKIVPNPSGREYPHGTTVELMPKPKEGWEFSGWEGDLNGKESPKRITVDKQKNVTAKFKEKTIYYVKKSVILGSTKFAPITVANTMTNVSAAFIYKDSKGDIFAFYPGNPIIQPNLQITLSGDNGFGGPCKFTSINPSWCIPAISSQILRKVNGQWEYFKEDEKALFWGARNYKLVGDNVVVSDANEIGTEPRDWKGNIMFGKILPGGNIDWKTVNKPEEMGYFHGITMGDLNKDGLLDFGGTPGIDPKNGPYRINFFMQEAPGVFKRNDEIFNITETTRPYFDAPFTLEFADLFGDNREEIITANYGGGAVPTSRDHEISIYSFSDQSQKFELTFRSNKPNAYTSGLGATSIRIVDFNKDGIKDIAVAREGFANGLQLHGFEVWIGKSNGTFEFSFSSPTWTEREMQFREFVVLDANNDGKDDIILIPFHYGSLYRYNPSCWWNDDLNLEVCNGIKLNHLIWLNNGNGTFDYYNKTPLVLPDVRAKFVMPYKEGNKLFFLGTNPNLNTIRNYEYDVFDIRVNIDGL